MTDHGDADIDVMDEFERLGRRAGAELRAQPPADGAGTVLRTARRRRATVATVAAGVTVAVVVTGLVFANSRIQDEPTPIATVPTTPAPSVPTTPAPSVPTTPAPVVPTTPAPVVPTSTPSGPAVRKPPDDTRTTTPGTWRTVPDPSSLAPDFAAAAVWTGTEAIVIGTHVTNGSELSPQRAAAYDVGRDQWRALADPPPNLTSALHWTGSAVLAATSRGEVYSYDPVQDRWQPRAPADETVSLDATNALVEVSPRGVLAHFPAGWWWYDDMTDRWEAVPAPSSSVESSMLNTLDQDRIVATDIDGSTIRSAVFDIAGRSWRSGPPVTDAPVSERPDSSTTCDANDGLLLCWTDDFGVLDGVVIDPLVGDIDEFELRHDSNTLGTRGLPWLTHAWKLLSPRSMTWEDLPPSPDGDVDSFSSAVWTGSEIVFFGGSDSDSTTAVPLGSAAAYTPIERPGT